MANLDGRLDELIKEWEGELLREFREYSNTFTNELLPFFSFLFNRRYHQDLATMSNVSDYLYAKLCGGEQEEITFAREEFKPVMSRYLHKLNEMYQRVAKNLGIELESTKIFGARFPL